MKTSSYDVVVVGAGPGGAATATLLARTGRRVALVDAAHFPRQKVCGEYLSAAAWEILARRRLNVDRSLAEPLSEFALHAAAGRCVTTPLSHDVALRPAALARDVFDARLVAAARSADADVFEGYRVRETLVESGRATGVVAVYIADSSRRHTLHAPLIIAADGRSSRVVRDTGTVRTKAASLVGYKRHVRVADFEPFRGRIAMHAARGGYVGVCPTAPGVVNVCGTVPGSLLQQFHGDLGASLRALLGPASPILPLTSDDGEPWHTMPEVACRLAKHRTPGVLYVGDAMGTIEPLTGQGMTMALAGAELLADFVTRSGATGAAQELQREYERAWLRTFRRPIAAAAWFGRLLRRPKLLDVVMRTTGCIPGLTAHLIERAHERTLTV